MDPNINFKEDFPVLDKILHFISPLFVAGAIFIVLHILQSIVLLILPIPRAGFSPSAIASWPVLEFINPMWIPSGVATVIVLVLMRRRQTMYSKRFKNHNIPTMFYDEPPVVSTPSKTQPQGAKRPADPPSSGSPRN